MKFPRAPVFALLAALALPAAHAAMLVDNYATTVNDRFQDSDSPDQFLLKSFDLSGVGLSSGGGWGTLIGPNTILSANHFHASGSVTFHADNDPLSTPITITLSGDSERINGTDLWVARLSSNAPASLKIYDYATAPISSLSYLFSPYRNQTVYMTGRSPNGSLSAVQSQAFGTNKVSGFVENNTAAGLGSVDALQLDYNPGGTTYESFFQGGDSGAPLFFNDGGSLLLLGVNCYVATNSTTGAPVASYVSYTGNESATIGAFVTQYAAVPEPSQIALLTVGLGAVVLVRRSRLIS